MPGSQLAMALCTEAFSFPSPLDIHNKDTVDHRAGVVGKG